MGELLITLSFSILTHGWPKDSIVNIEKFYTCQFSKKDSIHKKHGGWGRALSNRVDRELAKQLVGLDLACK